MNDSKTRRTEHSGPFSARTLVATLILVVLVAGGLRLSQLHNDSLWGDEVFEVRNVQRPLSAILASNPLSMRLGVAHIFAAFGSQEFVLRFPYAVWGILAVAVIYRVGRALFDGVTGAMAAFLLAISAFHVQYSQETRSYSLTVLLVLLSLYCIYQALQFNRMRHWAGFALLTALSVSNHLTAASAAFSEITFAGLVLVGERFSERGGSRSEGQSRRSDSPVQHDHILSWLRAFRSSRAAMLVASSLAGGLIFLVFSGAWLSYLRNIGVEAANAGSGTSAVFRFSWYYVQQMIREFGIGSGWASYILIALFGLGLLFCVTRGRWRQFILVPIWILPPYLFLSQTSANAPFFPKHLIFILPIYLLFVAHGIKNICELVSHLARGSSGKQTLLYGFCLVLAASGLSLANVQSLNHYYEGKKEDWRGTAALLAELVKPGDLIVQLTQWPTDPLPYYVESREEFDAVQLEELRSIDGDEFAATVWWVILIGQSGSTLSILPDPEQMVGADFDIRVLDSLPYKSPAIVRREQPIGDGAEFWRLTTKLLLVQAQADAWIKLWWYEDRLAEILELVGRSEVDLGACPPSSLDLVRAVGEAWEQAQEGDRKQAADTLLEAFAMHEVLFPGSERLHDGVIQALRKLANDTLVDGEQACADLFLARAVDAYVVAGQAEPERAEYWYGLATAAYELGRTKEASEAFERLLKLEPGNWQFHLEAAEAFWASGWQEETITALRRAADLAPNESRPHRRMADYYFLQGQMEQAALGFQRVLDLDPQDSEARFGLALAYEGQGRTAEAIQQLEDLIELDPHHWLVTEAQEKLTELKR